VPVIEVENRFHCPNSSCHCSFKQEHLLTQHMKDCEKEGFICPNTNCGKIYKNKKDLTRHMKDCGQIFHCSNQACSKSFNAESSLSGHLRVCGGELCPCGYLFRGMRYLVAHQTTCKVSFLFLVLFQVQLFQPFFLNSISTSLRSLKRPRRLSLRLRERASCLQYENCWRESPILSMWWTRKTTTPFCTLPVNTSTSLLFHGYSNNVH